MGGTPQPPRLGRLKADLNSHTELRLLFKLGASDICFCQVFVDHFSSASSSAVSQRASTSPILCLLFSYAPAYFTPPNKSTQSSSSLDTLLQPVQRACAGVPTPSTRPFPSPFQSIWPLQHRRMMKRVKEDSSLGGSCDARWPCGTLSFAAVTLGP